MIWEKNVLFKKVYFFIIRFLILLILFYIIPFFFTLDFFRYARAYRATGSYAHVFIEVHV